MYASLFSRIVQVQQWIVIDVLDCLQFRSSSAALHLRRAVSQSSFAIGIQSVGQVLVFFTIARQASLFDARTVQSCMSCLSLLLGECCNSW